MQDASTVLMGATQSSYKTVENHKGDIEAGIAVRLKSDDTLSVILADGSLSGVSLGKDLSNTGYCPIVRKGTRVPILLTAAFEPVIGAQVFISDTTGKAGASGAGFTGTNAFYSSLKLNARKEDGSTVANGVAYIDLAGGL